MLFSRSRPEARQPEVVRLRRPAASSSATSRRPISTARARPTCCAAITLDIKEGEFVSIMGPSGAGKSTLLHIIGMHDTAWTGEYWFLGQPVHALGEEGARRAAQEVHRLRLPELPPARPPDGVREPRRAAVVPQHPQGRARQHGVRHPRPLPDRREEGPLSRTSSRAASSSSSRWRARIIANPKVILADEPTGNLHSEQGREIMELFKKLNQAGHDDRAGHALGGERLVWRSHHPAARRLGGRLSTRPSGTGDSRRARESRAQLARRGGDGRTRARSGGVYVGAGPAVADRCGLPAGLAHD